MLTKSPVLATIDRAIFPPFPCTKCFWDADKWNLFHDNLVLKVLKDVGKGLVQNQCSLLTMINNCI